MAYDEGSLLQEALSNMPYLLQLPSWNDAVSLKAQLTRYIKSMSGIYDGRDNPFESLEMVILKPGILKFQYREGSRGHQLSP